MPCGTPDRTGAGDKRVPSRATCCVMLLRKDCIQLRDLLRTQ